MKRFLERNPRHYEKLYREVRLRALSIVGGGVVRCRFCGCSDSRVLEIHHLFHNGFAECKGAKKSGSYRGVAWYWAIIKGKRGVGDLVVACRVCNALEHVKARFPDVARRFKVAFDGDGLEPIAVKFASFQGEPSKTEREDLRRFLKRTHQLKLGEEVV